MAEEKINGCDCKTCRRFREYQHHIKLVPKESVDFWQKIFDILCMAEEDLNYVEAITVPELEEQIEELERRLLMEQLKENNQ